MISKLTKYFEGKRAFNLFWEKLYQLSLRGMNVGSGAAVEDSGELWLIRHFRDFLPSNATPPVVFDVGANVGNFARQMLSQHRTTIRLYCFEPSKRTFESLNQNLYGSENVTMLNFGMGDKEEAVTLYSDNHTSGLSSVYERRLNHFNIQMEGSEEILLKTIDSFCDQNRIPRIHFLKLDIEGHELRALQGAERMIRTKCIDLIQFEFGGCNIDSRTYFQDFFYLLERHYRLYRILKDGLASVETYRETLEMFLTTNYLAVTRRQMTVLH